MNKGSFFLIPTYLSDANDSNFLAPIVSEVIKNTTIFLVENVRTARRFISSLKLGIDISSLQFEVLDKNSTPRQVSELMAVINTDQDIGIISEAGLPGLADPGHLAVAYAHSKGIRVIPLPGASAIQTAVTTSGFSGQHFTFHGYLPIAKPERIKAIKTLDDVMKKTGFTQVFMETPFRNMNLLTDLYQHLKPNTQLHIAADIFGKSELIKTMSVSAWKKQKINLHKIPVVFCIGQVS